MRNAFHKKMTCKSVINHIVFPEIFQKGRLDIVYVSVFVIDEPIKNRGSIVDCPDQFDFRDIERIRGIEENIPRNTSVSEPLGDLFGNLLAPAVRAS
jgi:hypothetical protein